MFLWLRLSGNRNRQLDNTETEIGSDMGKYGSGERRETTVEQDELRMLREFVDELIPLVVASHEADCDRMDALVGTTLWHLADDGAHRALDKKIYAMRDLCDLFAKNRQLKRMAEHIKKKP